MCSTIKTTIKENENLRAAKVKDGTKEIYNILNRFTGEVQCSVEIECAPNTLPSVKLGLAVKAAVKENKSLRGADLSGAILSDVDLSDVDLSGAILRDAILRDAILRDADLRDADLSGAILGGADLRDADLRDVDLSGADLSGAILSYADLRGADLRGAILSGAILSGAILSGAILGGAIIKDGIEINLIPIQISNLYWPVTIYDQHMQIGCEFHSLHEWENFTDKEIIAMDGRNALEFWRANKEPILALAKANKRNFEPFLIQEVA